MPTNQRRIHTVAQLGRVVASTRIAQGLRATELTASHVFVSDLEHGKATAQIGKVLAVLADLGIEVILELPPGVELPDDFDQQPPRRRISR